MQELMDYLCLLTGQVNPQVQWQVFYDPKDGTKRPDLAKTFYCTVSDALDYLNWAQSQNAGVYVCINDTDGKGRELINITKLRVLFADYDGVPEPTWPIAPSFKTCRSNTQGHAYWLINSDEWDNDEWSVMQRRIAICCNTDPQVIDPCRVARVPVFKHLKNPSKPEYYRLVQGGTNTTYSKEQLLNSFRLSELHENELTQWIEVRKGIQTGEGYTDNPIYIDKSVKWLSQRAIPAIDGCGGTHTLYMSVAYLHDRGISLDLAKQLAWEHYNPRCEPSWSDSERHHFDSVIERAYLYAKSAPGCKTAIGEFSRLPPVTAPVAGWDENKRINDEPTIEVTSKPQWDRIKHDEAVILQSQLTSKSSHYDLARTFDGALYDGKKLYRFDKLFYSYTGKCWELISDEVIKSEIQRYYSKYKPSDTFTRGVYNCLCDLVTISQFKNKSWLNDEHTDIRNTIVFDNVIIDVSGVSVKVLNHTPEYVCFNALPHQYNPSSKCPRWLQWLDEIWGEDYELKNQLQEWFGYLLAGGNELQKMAIFWGKSRGGKSMVARIALTMVGEGNCTSTDLNEIYENSTKHDMYRSLITYMPDQEEVDFRNKNKVLGTLKGITGGDLMGWHVIYKGKQTGRIDSKLMMTTNNIPTFNDPSGALVNRMLLFPFNLSFLGREDPRIEQTIMSEIEGITNWAIEGLLRLRKNGKFTESQSSMDEKNELRESMFSLNDFIDEHCVIEDNAKVSIDELYKAYRIWATSSGVKSPFDKRRMESELKNSRYNITKSRLRAVGGDRNWFMTGIRLNGSLNFDNVSMIDNRVGR